MRLHFPARSPTTRDGRDVGAGRLLRVFLLAVPHFFLSVTAAAVPDRAPKEQHLTTDGFDNDDESHVSSQLLRREDRSKEQQHSHKSSPRTQAQPPVSLADDGQQRASSFCYNAKDIASISTSFVADATFWAERCKVIPPDTLAIRVKMGSVIDYYRPSGSSSWCDMMVSNQNHDWWDGSSWVTPVRCMSGTTDTLGGSGAYGATSTATSRPGSRRYLSFWGSNNGLGGGCCEDNPASPTCHNSNTGCGPFVPGSWGEKLLVSTCASCAVLREVDSNTLADEAYILNHFCPSIPTTANAIRITMDQVVDYYRPASPSTSLCSMLQAQDLHEWSPDAENWTMPIYLDNSTTDKYLGGSAEDWPATYVDGDSRKFLSFWGVGGTRRRGPAAATHKAGCCDTSIQGMCTIPTSASFPHICYGKSYKIEYCRIE